MIVFQWIKNLAQAIEGLLSKPYKVLFICLCFAFANSVIDGSLFSLWSLNQEYKNVQKQIALEKSKSQKLKMKIQRAGDLDFMELEARNRFNYVGENDLVFVFTDDQ